jgi:hypothetical protein
MTTALEGGEGSGSRPGHFVPPGKTRYPLYRRLGGTQGRSGQVWQISPRTGIRSPDRPARSQSLYRLRDPALQGKGKVLSIERGRARSHFVENWLWKGLGTCREPDYGKNGRIQIKFPTHSRHSYSITKSTCLLLFKEIIAVDCHVNVSCVGKMCDVCRSKWYV